MLKFIKHHMATIDGIDLFPVAAFLIFFIMFIVVLVRTWAMGRREADRFSALPLAEDDTNATTRHAH
ncbi:MAG: CcoQ/FixQ family Cbb3-type cytochrome c oxidase assembly chaperone [Flavobacteriales bacterium]|jgi:cbb3-type cytochrome oxidase subunit 3|nr:MAG: CcoQ/FixQ family Cbb3-type cytochrome c oxidase assembly chaperone [Flavobacteriales bacterium]